MAYFVAGIAIAIIAGFGLKQIALTKKIATANAKRESLKFAAERCQYYAEKCVPLFDKVCSEHKKLGLTFLNTAPQFSIVDGEIRFHNLDQAALSALSKQYSQMTTDLIQCLNSAEAFAIPFAAGVADDEVGFQETAAAFCREVEQLIGALFLLRKGGMKFESTVKVYDHWKSRLVALGIEDKMKQMQEQHKKVAEKGKIKPPDTY
jgi:hypothetical protein